MVELLLIVIIQRFQDVDNQYVAIRKCIRAVSPRRDWDNTSSISWSWRFVSELSRQEETETVPNINTIHKRKGIRAVSPRRDWDLLKVVVRLDDFGIRAVSPRRDWDNKYTNDCVLKHRYQSCLAKKRLRPYGHYEVWRLILVSELSRQEETETIVMNIKTNSKICIRAVSPRRDWDF